jgi:hypothetical protein
MAFIAEVENVYWAIRIALQIQPLLNTVLCMVKGTETHRHGAKHEALIEGF